MTALSPLAVTVDVPVPVSGRALVLLHGFPLDHRMWDDVVQALVPRGVDRPGGGGAGGTGGTAASSLPDDVGLLRPDLPGLGATPVPEGEPDLTVSARALGHALDAAGVTSAVVVGMSMGGYVALALLRERADLVAGLGLVDTKHTADTAQARQGRLRAASELEASGTTEPVRPMSVSLLAASARGARTDLSARVAATIAEQAPAGLAWSQRAMAARPDSTTTLRSFAHPGLVVVGDEDDVTPPALARSMAGLLADAELVEVPRAGHLAAMEQPALVAGALQRLVSRTYRG